MAFIFSIYKLCVGVGVGGSGLCAHVHEHMKKALHLLELELHAVVSHGTQVLETELQSSKRAQKCVLPADPHLLPHHLSFAGREDLKRIIRSLLGNMGLKQKHRTVNLYTVLWKLELCMKSLKISHYFSSLIHVYCLHLSTWSEVTTKIYAQGYSS